VRPFIGSVAKARAYTGAGIMACPFGRFIPLLARRDNFRSITEYSLSPFVN